MNVLVDTSVWVNHFRRPNSALAHLLMTDQVILHPMVIGELACGTPPQRQQTLSDLARLRSTHISTQQEVLVFIEQHQLFGMGCGWIDINLLASVLISPEGVLWTEDKRLAKLAKHFDIAWSEQ
tara:strand:- start:1901 stop:2272 length:372 start_codon:yes stop_codon:yes gene_type:complete